ncbi:MAG: acetate/propionate family kinase [Methyloprofundus sp.]|nr:acetate/propionate family kinase [Methyloprofundus sp.]
MKILVLNSGSSSLKFQLFALDSLATQNLQLLASGLVEKIAEAQGAIQLDYLNAQQQLEHFSQASVIANHQQALEVMTQLLKSKHCLESMQDLAGIGHRVVHGGEHFTQATLIDAQVIDTIDKLSPLAPLHNPANLTGIALAQQKAPKVPQVAVFDTSFHQTLAKSAYIYALPYALYEKHQVRRYGFHGTSHHYVAKQASAYLTQRNAQDAKLITVHLGNGASICAILNGQSIDTSMGMTPLEGLVMGTRCGDIDPAILLYLNRETGMSFAELDTLVNKKSGLKGVCGTNDMRSIIERAEQGDPQAELAIHIFAYRIKKYMGAYFAALNGLDAVIFTGGIGEHSSVIRALVCQDLDALGIQVDTEKNNSTSKESLEIQSEHSAVKVLVIPTNEELEIAEQTLAVIS